MSHFFCDDLLIEINSSLILSTAHPTTLDLEIRKVHRSSPVDTFSSIVTRPCEEIETGILHRCHHCERQTEIVEGKSNHAASWKWDSPSVLRSDRYRRTDGQAGTSNRPFSSNRRCAFPRDEAFHIRQAPKTRGGVAVCLSNLCAVAFLQQS